MFTLNTTTPPTMIIFKLEENKNVEESHIPCVTNTINLIYFVFKYSQQLHKPCLCFQIRN